MLKGRVVELQAIERADLRTIWRWYNDVELELLAGGDIRPVTFTQMEAHFDKELKEEPVMRFAIVVNGLL
ncbi:MAG: hypothetical protein QOG21_1846, partial [Actinomycetota bacterium]|nr:hypothetical protein [Actinomycetota bacterium]